MTLASTVADAASVSIYLGDGYGPYVGGPYVRGPYVRGPYARGPYVHPHHPGWHRHHRYHGPVVIKGWNRYNPHFHPRPAYPPVYSWR